MARNLPRVSVSRKRSLAGIAVGSRITISNVVSKAKSAILVGGSLCDSVLNNIVQQGPGEAVTVASGSEYMRDVKLTNILVQKY